MFERFTETARRTLFFARQETTDIGGAAIEAEHLLLALLRADTGPTPHVFAVADLSYSEARAAIRAHRGEQPRVSASVEIPFSDQTQRILQYATEEADRACHKDIGAEHLLLGVLREDSSFAAGMLRSHGMTIDDLREHIVKPPVVPEPAPDAPALGGGTPVKGAVFDALVCLERIRYLAEELARSRTQVDETRGLVDELHAQLDALKRHLA
jgi:ATP-dependent Clp protease ATP-binding subunit ClpA